MRSKKQNQKINKEKEELVKQFGFHLRIVRKSRDISQEELANRIFLDRSHLSRLETGGHNPSIYLIDTICRALDLSLADFFKDFEKNKEEYKKKKGRK